MNDDVIKLFCAVDDFCVELQEKIVSKTIEKNSNIGYLNYVKVKSWLS